jgi:hypothetical protein
MLRSFLPSALAAAGIAFSVPVIAQDAPITVNGQALSKWKEAESDHFLIYSDGDEKYLGKLAGRLEAVHYLLKAATGMQEPANHSIVKVKVFAVGDVADVRRLIGDPQSPAAGYYDAQLAGALSVIPRDAGSSGSFSAELILFHEYAHHFMLQYQAAVYPAWYVEGFAEIVGTASFERPGVITYGKAAKHRESELRYSRRYPAAKMVDGSFVKEKRGAEGWEYGDAWALSHYLTFSEKRKGQLGAYLRAINSGQPFAEAAKVFGNLNDLTREVNIYIDGGSFPYKTPTLPAEVQKAPAIRPLTIAQAEFLEDQVVMERLATISTREEYDVWAKRREKEGKPLKKDYDSYYKEESEARSKWMEGLNARVARFANDPSAWAVKAHAECMAKDFAACQTSADRALALDPNSWEAQMRKGQALIGLAKEGPEAGRAASAKEGRKWVLKANASNPPAHEPLLYYYQSFAAEGKRAPDNALQSLQQVVDTIPQIGSTRLTLGGELAARKQWAAARKTLAPLAFSPHESNEQAAAQAMLEKMEAEAGASAVAAAAGGGR